MSTEGLYYKFLLKKLEGYFCKNAQNKKSPKNSKKILEKSLNLEIEYFTKYNSFFHKKFLHWIKNLILYLSILKKNLKS